MVELSSKESRALYKWAGVDLSQSCNDDQLLLAGSIRNVIRAAEEWGPKLVAILAANGLIDSESTPEDALIKLIEFY
jgi:hypothetical protein